jgi:hypothetical protein
MGAKVFALYIITCKYIATVRSSAGKADLGRANAPHHSMNAFHGPEYVFDVEVATWPSPTL